MSLLDVCIAAEALRLCNRSDVIYAGRRFCRDALTLACGVRLEQHVSKCAV